MDADEKVREERSNLTQEISKDLKAGKLAEASAVIVLSIYPDGTTDGALHVAEGCTAPIDRFVLYSMLADFHRQAQEYQANQLDTEGMTKQ